MILLLLGVPHSPTLKKKRAPSSRLWKQLMMGLSSSCERDASFQNVQNQLQRSCRSMRPWALRRPVTCTRLYIYFSVFCIHASAELQLSKSAKGIIRGEVHQENKHICIRGLVMAISKCVVMETVKNMERDIKVSASSCPWIMKSSSTAWGELTCTSVLYTTTTCFKDPSKCSNRLLSQESAQSLLHSEDDRSSLIGTVLMLISLWTL